MKTLSGIILFFFIISSCFGQINELSSWYGYGVRKSINPSFSVGLFLQYRNGITATEHDKVLFLSEIGYKPRGTHYSYGVYQYSIHLNPLGVQEEDPFNYQFLGQQIGYFHHFKNIQFNHKLKLEQVWKKDLPFYQQSRLFTSVKFPIIQQAGKMHIFISTELFWKLKEKNLFRNRLFYGFVFNINKSLLVQPGLLVETYSGYHESLISISIKHNL